MTDYYSCPRISSEYPDCSLPLTADSSSLCTFKCSYCFAAYQHLNNPSLKGKPPCTNPLNFEHFEKMMRGGFPDNPYYKNFIAHRFPIHFGGLSDSFDYYEAEKGTTLKLLKLFAELNYPVIFSTKGKIMVEGEYYEVLKKAAPNHNFIFQFSIITNNQKKATGLELNTPSVDERFAAMKKLSDLGYWCVLRLRPFIIGASDDDLEGLFKKAHDAGAKALSTEFYCVDVKVSGEGKLMYDTVSNVVGYDVIRYYKALSPSERGGYRRLNREVKEPYIKRMWLLCKKYGMQFNCSDPDYKELNQSGSCCGIPESREKYNSDCTGWSKGQLTYMITKLMERYMKGETDLELHIEEILDKVPNKWSDEKKYYGDSLKNWSSDVQNKDMCHKYEFIQMWNNIRSASNPYNYFNGLLTPFKVDANKNVIYKFNPPAYIQRWKKEGIL
jgi:DNA repair photolyase